MHVRKDMAQEMIRPQIARMALMILKIAKEERELKDSMDSIGLYWDGLNAVDCAYDFILDEFSIPKDSANREYLTNVMLEELPEVAVDEIVKCAKGG